MNRFEQFIKEKTYLQNVSPNTLRWYKHALKWLACESPDERQLKDMVVKMRERGMKATGCNAAIRAINCYLRWSGSPHKIQSLREEKMVMPTFTIQQVKLLVGFKPSNDFERRLHLLILILFDTGARISEALGIQTSDVDLDNLLIVLHGKGRKDRKVAISLELRKHLFRYMNGRDDLLFITDRGNPWTRLNVLHSVKFHCQHRLGFKPPARTLHAIRHTWATNFIRKGGSPFLLQRAMGHTTLCMTNKYVALNTDDLSAVQQKVSLLS